jgi:hypothetical protein
MCLHPLLEPTAFAVGAKVHQCATDGQAGIILGSADVRIGRLWRSLSPQYEPMQALPTSIYTTDGTLPYLWHQLMLARLNAASVPTSLAQGYDRQ